ncbi:MAG: Asp-tRNA(Asn)/Glu-tRNA(Gln) amidotransferase GatCAB subunit A, partial [Chloroflexota bacterium]
MHVADLLYAPIRAASAALRRREVSAAELTEAALARIAERNSLINAYITVTTEAARDAAQRADAELRAGIDRGPLHGIPVGVKDLFDVAGVPTTAGSPLF